MITLTDFGSLSDHVGQTIVAVGEPRNAKAGPLLLDARARAVPCSGQHWPDELLGQQVEVVARVIASSGGPDFPVATQGPDGAWSQGVGGMDPGGLRAALGLPIPDPAPTLSLQVAGYSVCGD